MPLRVMQPDISGLEPGETKLLNKLRALYSTTDYDAHLDVQPIIDSLIPDFILIDPYKGVCIIEVKDWSLSFLENITPTTVTDINGQERYNPVYRARQYFNALKDLLHKEPYLLNEEKQLRFRLYSKVVFSNMNSSELEALKEVLCQPVTDCISSDQLASLSIETFFGHDSIFLDKNTISVVRGKIFPEIQVKKIQTEIWQYNKIKSADNKIVATLDYEQEKFARRIPEGHYMITGVPGSGKTVILIARAIHLLRENPNWKVLILTYNKSLNKRIKSQIESKREDLCYMGINYENLEISTFNSLAERIAEVGFVPNRDKDFYDMIPYLAFDKAQPLYDAVLIDEYQDFFDIWFKLCLKICKKHTDKNGNLTENIFLAGDRLQSIYNPKEHNWKNLGINIVGRSKLLKMSYRSGSSHIDMALNYLMLSDELRKEVEKFYEGRDGICQNFDSDNTVTFFNGYYKEINNTLLELLNSGYNPEDIIVLGPSNNGNNYLYQHLDESIKQIAEVSKDIDKNKLIITTYHSSKGLENKVCILLNIDRLDNKKLVYVGLTRASEKLYIHSKEPGDVFEELRSCYERR
ncbi:UvrD-helicase domain-containing protein [uncultured Methanomethylovorans sp.]|uniref:nuclease-related domain-containing DEAD/DEAH box helicase n=1 Tax=uncultured Methanomethylovorans sp. TaxID=183759 RepID=UPI002AA922E3|nr:UvrD-helicase domain-containing protein [uncultured Methanomethylovorans sp.]